MARFPIKLSRRSALKNLAVASAGLSTTGGLISGSTTQDKNIASIKDGWKFDLNNPQDAIDAYVKMVGSLAKERVFIQYYGEIFSAVHGEMHKPLLRLKGLVRSDWAPNEAGSYSFTNYDQGLFCDYETGEVLESFKNPYTGETNIPLHYKSGPIAAEIGTGESQRDPTKNDWRITGNQIFVNNSRASRFENPVSPEKWGKASTGKYLLSHWMSTYISNTEDVANPDLNSVETDHTWTYVTGYPAWTLMGDFNGHAVWRWIARKFSDPSLIDPYIAEQVEKQAPGFFTSEKPWPLRSDGWTQYTRERTPSEY